MTVFIVYIIHNYIYLYIYIYIYVCVYMYSGMEGNYLWIMKVICGENAYF